MSPKNYRKNPFPPIFDLCWCGCGQIVYGGKRYILNHHHKNVWNKGLTAKDDNRIIVGKNHPSIRLEVREKLSKALIGHKHSVETKRKISISHIGKVAWNKGIPCSEKTKQKLSEINKNHKPTEETKRKISNATRGNKNPNWRNGLSESKYCYKWNKNLREQIRKRDNYICQMPGCLCTQLESLVLYRKSLSIHHIHYDKPNCEPDLITLCIYCNSNVNFNREYYEKLFMDLLKRRELVKL